MNYTYNIDNLLSKNESHETLNRGDKVFICIYEILFKINSTGENPFIQYLLYKYNESDSLGEILTFPFITYNSGNILKTAKKYINDLLDNSYNLKGHMSFNGNMYVFFGKENRNFVFKKLQSNNKFWWCLIDEICNKKKVVNYLIHESVPNLFYNNTELIYLRNNEGLIEIPVVVYRGDHIDIIPYLATFGQRRSTRSRFGPFYTFGTFNWSVRWAGWSRTYAKHTFKNKAITDDNGKYLKGGIIRYAIFLDDLEKNHVVMDTKKEYFKNLFEWFDGNKDKNKKEKNEWYSFLKQNTGKWSTKFTSLTVPKIKFKHLSGYFNINTEFIISDHKKKVTLSIHELDNSTLKTVWDPLYENYQIL